MAGQKLTQLRLFRRIPFLHAGPPIRRLQPPLAHTLGKDVFNITPAELCLPVTGSGHDLVDECPAPGRCGPIALEKAVSVHAGDKPPHLADLLIKRGGKRLLGHPTSHEGQNGSPHGGFFPGTRMRGRAELRRDERWQTQARTLHCAAHAASTCGRGRYALWKRPTSGSPGEAPPPWASSTWSRRATAISQQTPSARRRMIARSERPAITRSSQRPVTGSRQAAATTPLQNAMTIQVTSRPWVRYSGRR